MASTDDDKAVAAAGEASMDVDGAQATAAPPKASTKPASKAPKPPPSAQGGAAGAAAAASENDDDGDGGDEKAGDDKRERKQRRASATGSKKIKAQLGGEESAEEDSGSVATEPGEEEEETESVSMEEEDDETPAKGSARRKSQATGGGSGSGAGPSSSIRKDTDKLLEKLRDEVAQLDGTLEEGWTVKANVRTGGATAGTYDVYYIAPNGKRYRSRTEVFRALGLIEGGPVSAGKRSAAGSGAKRSGKPAPPLVPTDVAYANAKTRAEGLQDKSLPLAAEAPGVLVHRLGELSADRGFHCAGNLWPVGFAATWQQQPAAGAGGEASGSSAGPVLVSAIARGASGAAFRVYISKPEGGGSREQLAEAAAASGGGDSDQLLLLAEASHPDAAWKRVAAMHAAAHGSNTDAADKPSKPAGEAPAAEPADAAASAAAPLPAAASPAEKKAPELTVEQHAALQALPTGSLPPKPWGLQLYGLTTPAVLQLLEALPAADACSAYLFAEQRGGWDAVVQQIKIDQLKAAGLRKRASGAADGDGAKRPRKSGAGGQRTLESFFALKVTDAKDADEFAGQAYDPSDEAHISSQVTKLLNIMIDKVEAAERVDALREASRKSKEAGEGRKPRGPPMTEEEKKKKRNEALAAKRAKEREEKAEAERQRREAVAALMVSNGAAEGAAAALAAGAQSLPDELLPGSTLQPPQGERLSPPPGATDRELPLLLQLHAFLGRFQSVLGLDAVPPSAAALHDLLASDPSSSPAAWADCASLHGCLVRCLVREAYDELLAYVKDTSDLVQKDLANAEPPVTAECWTEAARRYMLAVATSSFLAVGETESTAIEKIIKLPAPLDNLEPQDWLQYLMAGVNFPDLVSNIALLPQKSAKFAADALIACDDARALAAAEQLLHARARGDNAAVATVAAAGGPNKEDGGSGGGVDVRRLSQEAQLKVCRRILLRIHQAVIEAAPRGAELQESERLSYYGPEFSTAVRAPRGTDLHAIAARLDAGLYQATGNTVEALAADVRAACGLWRLTMSPQNVHKIAHNERFVTGKLEMADVIEKALADAVADLEAIVAEVSSAEATAEAAAAQALVVAAQDALASDVHALDTPARLFLPINGGCRVCWTDQDQGRLLVCDRCDDEYHCYCVEPPLLYVPEEDWFCPACMSGQKGQAAALVSPFKQQQQPKASGTEHKPISAAGGAAAAAAVGTSASAVSPASAGATKQHVFNFRTPHLQASMDKGTPGLEAIRDLLDSAHLLGSTDYGQLPAQRRLELLTHLCDLATSTAAVRKHLDASIDAQREAKREITEIRTAAKAAAAASKKEAAAAAAATAGGEAGADYAAGGKKGAAKKGAAAGGKKGAAGGGNGPALKATRGRGAAGTESAEDAARISFLEATMECNPIRGALLGYDRHYNRYWTLLRPAGEDAAAAAAAAAAANGGAKPKSSKQAAQQQAAVPPPPPVVGVLLEQLPPRGTGQPLSVPEGVPPGTTFYAYTTHTAVGGLVDFMHKSALREGPLRQALLKVRDQLAGAAAAAAPSSAAGQAAAKAGDVEMADAAAAGGGGGAEGGRAQSEAAGEATPADALRQQLLQVYQSLPAESFTPLWGSPERQALWIQLVETGSRPTDMAAAVLLLEQMLAESCFRPHWRLCATPAQNPDCVQTWAGAWYRLLGLMVGIKKTVLSGKEVPGVGAARKLRSTAPAGGPPEPVQRAARYAARYGSSTSLNALAGASSGGEDAEDAADGGAAAAVGQKRKAGSNGAAGGSKRSRLVRGSSAAREEEAEMEEEDAGAELNDELQDADAVDDAGGPRAQTAKKPVPAAAAGGGDGGGGGRKRGTAQETVAAGKGAAGKPGGRVLLAASDSEGDE